MARKPKTRSEVAAAVLHELESLGRSGVTHLPRPRPGKSRPAEGGSQPARAATTPPVASASAPVEDRESALVQLARRVSRCTRCAELAATRTQTVFGLGNPHARLVFMGEAPGADEDREGFPFVGRAGQLLTKIIEACGFTRDQVYILNTLKCRPPGNRTPLPEEAANCREYLDGQLAIIQPEFLCCLGAVAAQNLLGTDRSIGKLRGTIHSLGKCRVVCTYHPAYLLRNPAAKRDTWDDMKMLLAAMGLQPPGGVR